MKAEDAKENLSKAGTRATHALPIRENPSPPFFPCTIVWHLGFAATGRGVGRHNHAEHPSDARGSYTQAYVSQPRIAIAS